MEGYSDYNKKVKFGIRAKLSLISRVPVLVMGILISFGSFFFFRILAENEVERNLSNAIDNALYTYELAYGGDYSLIQGTDGIAHLYKGSTDISNGFDVLDTIKNSTGLDLTLFAGDVRFLTTLQTDGERFLYTKADEDVAFRVLQKEESVFLNRIRINGVKYYAYYQPIYNNDGDVFGMGFAGKPTHDIDHDAFMDSIWILAITAVMYIVSSLLSAAISSNMIEAIYAEKYFLKEISEGNLDATIDVAVLNMEDELGDMGRFMVHVQSYIKDMVERDALTRLYSRKIGKNRLNYTHEKLISVSCDYCIAMCDIDFFKSFNDTYGHDCGDLVLKNVSSIIRSHLERKGYAIRWGGEEILIVYENYNLEKAKKELAELRESIVTSAVEYEQEPLSITMTFGLVQADGRDPDEIIKDADGLMYYGKQHGRDRIVTEDDIV